MLKKWTDLKGLHVPVITPYTDDGEIDEEGLADSIRFLVDSGVHGICISCGTGEEAFLSRDERKLNLAVALKEVNGKVPVIAGTGHGTFSTKETIEYIKDAKDGGADAQLLALDARVSEQGIYDYFMDAAKVGLPIIIYGLGTPRISPTMVKRLLDSDTEMIFGIKDCINSDLEFCIHLNGHRTSVFTGNDNYMLQAFALGARGAICTLGNVVPKLMLDIYNGVKNSDLKKARESYYRLLPIVEYIYLTKATYPSATKYLCEALGRPGGIARRPQRPLTAEEKKQGREILKAAGLL